MILKKHLPEDRDFSILGTDIDTNVLNTSLNGVYPTIKKHEIPVEYQNYINNGKNEIEGWFRISPEIKKHVSFEQFNLMSSDLPGESMYDLVLCRNVLIYFSQTTVAEVCQKLYGATRDAGICMIGHSESFQNVPNRWKNMAPSVYRK